MGITKRSAIIILIVAFGTAFFVFYSAVREYVPASEPKLLLAAGITLVILGMLCLLASLLSDFSTGMLKTVFVSIVVMLLIYVSAATNYNIGVYF